MSDILIGKIVRVSRELETDLSKYLEAEGKGLHEKVTSVQDKLSVNDVKQIRFIASIRNNLVHDADSNISKERIEAAYTEALNVSDSLKRKFSKNNDWVRPSQNIAPPAGGKAGTHLSTSDKVFSLFSFVFFVIGLLCLPFLVG